MGFTEMTNGLLRFLRTLNARDPNGMGAPMDACNDRATAVRLGLIAGKNMKVGHRKMYWLTAAGRAALQSGKLK
jgi:hypothetical protein